MWAVYAAELFVSRMPIKGAAGNKARERARKSSRRRDRDCDSSAKIIPTAVRFALIGGRESYTLGCVHTREVVYSTPSSVFGTCLDAISPLSPSARSLLAFEFHFHQVQSFLISYALLFIPGGASPALFFRASSVGGKECPINEISVFFNYHLDKPTVE